LDHCSDQCKAIVVSYLGGGSVTTLTMHVGYCQWNR